MTQRNQRELGFAPHFSRQVVAGFEDRQLSTEGGALLLRETDRKLDCCREWQIASAITAIRNGLSRFRKFWPS
jgi:hypothetical protein